MGKSSKFTLICGPLSVGYGTITSIILVLLFVILKLTGIISWSWLWVFSPFWIPAIVCSIAFLILFIIYVKYN